jgi:hypothetical protein
MDAGATLEVPIVVWRLLEELFGVLPNTRGRLADAAPQKIRASWRSLGLDPKRRMGRFRASRSRYLTSSGENGRIVVLGLWA